MTRLIDADELKQAEKRISNLPWGDWHGNKVGFTWMPHEVQRLIDRSPTIDAVEVVRCNDCRWWNGNIETMHNDHLCRNWSKFGSIGTSADDFCSYGERIDDNDVCIRNR